VAATVTAPGNRSAKATPGGSVGAAALALLALALLGLIISVISGVLAAERSGSDGSAIAGDPYAVENFGAMYHDAAAVFGVNQYLLMAVHEDETNYGRSTLPGVHDGVNTAGCCAGPMQFSIVGRGGGTWGAYKDSYLQAKLERPASYPNRYEPHPNVYDSYDSIYAAAAYFKHLGAGPKLDAATFTALMSYKGRPPFSAPFALHDYLRAQELERESTLANGMAIGDTAPRTVARVIAVANWIAQQKLPYCWAAGHGPHPGPSTGTWCVTGDGRRVHSVNTVGLDCSGAVRWLLVLSGYPDPGGRSSYYYGSYLKSGSGQHVTFHYGPPRSGIGHIYATIDGRVWEASPAAPGALAGWSGSRPGTGYASGFMEGL
jgi:hypothetical protein